MRQDGNGDRDRDGRGARPDAGMRRALGLASDDVPTPDGLAETTWLRGRRVRRRRTVAGGVGAAAAASVTVLAWAVLGPAGLPTREDVIPAGSVGATPAPAATTGPVLVETAPEPSQDERASVPVDASTETRRVWGVLRSSCLASRGYEVVVAGSTLTATQQGAQSGDYSRDTALCDAELGMRLPPVEIAFDDGRLSGPADAALRAVYEDYVQTAACVRAAGLPVDDAPGADEFVELFAREWMPSWHPWTAAAVEGDYAQVRSACPVSTP